MGAATIIVDTYRKRAPSNHQQHQTSNIIIINKQIYKLKIHSNSLCVRQPIDNQSVYIGRQSTSSTVWLQLRFQTLIVRTFCAANEAFFRRKHSHGIYDDIFSAPNDSMAWIMCVCVCVCCRQRRINQTFTLDFQDTYFLRFFICIVVSVQCDSVHNHHISLKAFHEFTWMNYCYFHLHSNINNHFLWLKRRSNDSLSL